MYISSLRTNKKRVFHAKLLCFFIIFTFILVFTMIRVINVCEPFLENRAKNIAIDIINSGVSDYLSENGEIFSQIIDIKNLDSGRVSSALVNTYSVNLIKSGLSLKLAADFVEDKTYTIRIPLANILGITYLSGIGIPLTLKIEPASRVLVDLENNFYSSGINQTHYSLSLKIKANVMIVLPGIRKSAAVETKIPVGEAVFMGDVPTHFLDLKK